MKVTLNMKAATIIGMMTLREKNRRRMLRETQREGMTLFLRLGFGAVLVEDIAAAVGVAGSTIYRHFKTKENIVLWDEHDEVLDAVLTDRLKNQAPLEAIRDAFVETLAERYQTDFDFQLARVRFIYATPALHAAAIEADFRAREELTRGLTQTLSKKHKAAAPLLAGASLLALDVAMDRWQQNKGKRGLDTLIAAEFDRLSGLATIY
ncbi:MAG: AcrR family transcriptional regulator [Candidatus Azotimanducaceae bacterium]|jgi:AcrR family transcriptional regulator